MTTELTQQEIEMLKWSEPSHDERFCNRTVVDVNNRTHLIRVWTDVGMDPIRQIISKTKDKGITMGTLMTKAAAIGIPAIELFRSRNIFTTSPLDKVKDGIVDQLIEQGEVASICTGSHSNGRGGTERSYKYVATPKMKIPSGVKPSANRTTSKTNTNELVEVLWAIESHLAVIASALKKVN